MSGTKLDKGKAPISLIPREALLEEAKALEFGAQKYGRYNFRAGIEYSRLIDAALRHILALADGEDIDQESGCNHAANARANLGMLLYMMAKHPEKDDRYKPTEEVPFIAVPAGHDVQPPSMSSEPCPPDCYWCNRYTSYATPPLVLEKDLVDCEECERTHGKYDHD